MPRKNRQFVNPERLRPCDGYTNVIRAGQHVYITAQLPIDEHGNVPTDFADQVRQVWRNIEVAIKSVGGELRDLVQCHTHVTKAEYMPIVLQVRKEVFPVDPPTTSRPIVVSECSTVSNIGVSISAIGYIDD